MALFSSLWRRPELAKRDSAGNAGMLLPGRSSGGYSVSVDADSSMSHSAVWACIRLRAGLVSTMPLGVFRDVDVIPMAQRVPQFLKTPGGSQADAVTGAPNVALMEWLYSTQVDLDRYGNCFGIVTARDAMGFPATVELVPADSVRVKATGSRVVSYSIGRETYQPSEIWHERQYTVPGSPVGLSPLAYGAMSISSYLSAQKFANDFFSTGVAPSALLTNDDSEIAQSTLQQAKDRAKVAAANRDILVMSSDWKLQTYDVGNINDAFIREMEYGVTDICRFYDVPADLIDAVNAASNVTYANVSQRNLQLLTLHLGPCLARRENALTNALPEEYYVKFNRDSLMAMDPQTYAKLLIDKVKGRTLAPSEARALEGRAPYTSAQEKEFELLATYSNSISDSTSQVILPNGGN
jgi:HK97 family phage portal protein